MEDGNTMEIKVIKGGPYVVSGNFKVILQSGEESQTTEKTFFCRCGLSKNKPFCDGSHKESDFDK